MDLKIGIYARNYSTETTESIRLLIRTLQEHHVHYFVHAALYESLHSELVFPTPPNLFTGHQDIGKKLDYLFSFGGDGTLLSTITFIRDSGIPVIGINTGRLGFLSSLSRDEISTAVHYILMNKHSLDKRTLLNFSVDNNPFGNDNFALNDVTIHKRVSHSMILIHAYVDDDFLNAYWADGLIIATPTGSTGYSLSCGGPILTPVCENFVITPIATHNLTVRPMVIANDKTIRLKISGRHDAFLVSLDSRSASLPVSSEPLIVTREKFTVSLVRLDKSFFDNIRNKLGWGKDIRLK